MEKRKKSKEASVTKVQRKYDPEFIDKLAERVAERIRKDRQFDTR